MNNGATVHEEISLAVNSDILLCTSKELAENYCKKHLKINVVGEYWANTVDLIRWDYDSLAVHKVSNESVVFGYAGNMNEITINLDLVDVLIDEFRDCIFKFAGEINFVNSINSKKFRKIFDKKNVVYLGKIPYDEIPMEVVSWDVCLMLDNFGEISSYVHHNKVYQYLAMGKAVVSTKTHNDYTDLHNGIYESNTIDEFVVNLKAAMIIKDDELHIDQRRSLARKNSSEVRADQFMKIVHNHYGFELI
jgi:glycosyltransferase involved in cell wall biosynthesis